MQLNDPRKPLKLQGEKASGTRAAFEYCTGSIRIIYIVKQRNLCHQILLLLFIEDSQHDTGNRDSRTGDLRPLI
jgi:hypothetical protein